MPLDPPIKLAHRFPVAATVTVASIALSILLWTGTDLDSLIATRATVARAPWTLLTSTFIHLSPIHLLFNLSWWWPFACRIEYAWGKQRLIGLTILLAVISGAAQIGLDNPGVGLSGVVYGVFALLAVVQHTHPMFRGLISRNTIWMFAAWFVVCIILSITNVLKVGNVAHGSAIAGYLLGRCIIAAPGKRTAWIAALTTLGIASVTANFVTLPHLHTSQSAEENAYRGTEAYKKGDYKEAARLLELARRADPGDFRHAYNLGLTYQQLRRDDEALDLFREVAAKEPSARASAAPIIAAILGEQAADAVKAGDLTTALERLEEALEWDPENDFAQSLQHQIRKSISNQPAPK